MGQPARDARVDDDRQDYEAGEDREADRIQSLDERFGKIEAKQAEHGALLEQIKDALGGKGPARGAHDKAEQRTQDRLEHPPAQDIAEQVRRAVAEVGAEQAAKQAEADHKADHERLRERERAPREAMGGWRGKLAVRLYGPAD